MKLIPIQKELIANKAFLDNPLCQNSIHVAVEFYQKTGYAHPWIGYYVVDNDVLVGSAAFKGKPVNGTVEIAYGTFEQYRKQGIGTMICKQLVDLALATDPLVRITARTIPENIGSNRILEKNSFVYSGTVNDPEDGEVWEWIYKQKTAEV